MIKGKKLFITSIIHITRISGSDTPSYFFCFRRFLAVWDMMAKEGQDMAERSM